MSGEQPSSGVLVYRRARFATHLPESYRYSRGHFWLCETSPGLWRAGLTAYGVRMLGETVECEWEVQPGQRVSFGAKLGWIEGFKAVSDIGSLVEGEFAAHNPALAGDLTLVDTDPHGRGWLYEARGRPDPDTVDAHGYGSVLDEAIDAMLARHRREAAE